MKMVFIYILLHCCTLLHRRRSRRNLLLAEYLGATLRSLTGASLIGSFMNWFLYFVTVSLLLIVWSVVYKIWEKD